jgi:hypothetical protein
MTGDETYKSIGCQVPYRMFWRFLFTLARRLYASPSASGRRFSILNWVMAAMKIFIDLYRQEGFRLGLDSPFSTLTFTREGENVLIWSPRPDKAAVIVSVAQAMDSLQLTLIVVETERHLEPEVVWDKLVENTTEVLGAIKDRGGVTVCTKLRSIEGSLWEIDLREGRVCLYGRPTLQTTLESALTRLFSNISE